MRSDDMHPPAVCRILDRTRLHEPSEEEHLALFAAVEAEKEQRIERYARLAARGLPLGYGTGQAANGLEGEPKPPRTGRWRNRRKSA